MSYFRKQMEMLTSDVRFHRQTFDKQNKFTTTTKTTYHEKSFAVKSKYVRLNQTTHISHQKFERREWNDKELTD